MKNQFNFEASPFAYDDRSASVNNPQYIRRMQQALNRKLGLQLPLDGVMGFRTRRAIRNFQLQKGLPSDGLVSPDTDRALFGSGEQANGQKKRMTTKSMFIFESSPVNFDINETFEDELYQPAESKSALEGFIGTEHRHIGDLALGKQPTAIVFGERGERLTFGEVIALAGDYFETYSEIRELSKTREGRAKIAWSRWRALEPNIPKKLQTRHRGWMGWKALEPCVPDPVKANVRERYYVLASNNISHFSAGGTAWTTYLKWHTQAILAALQSGQENSAAQWRRALSIEAFADHFLTDMFSAGHVRTPRAEMREWYGRNFKGTIDRFIRYMAKEMYDDLNKRNKLTKKARLFSGRTHDALEDGIRKIGGKAIHTFSLGDIVSLALHNLDNKKLQVVSEVDTDGNRVPGGYPWEAVGDSHLEKTMGDKTKLMVVRAVKGSLQDLQRIRDAGRAVAGHPIPSTQTLAFIKKTLGGEYTPRFAAAAFVPKEDRTPGRNTPLPRTGIASPLEWRWGKLGSVAYCAVDETIRKDIADQLLERLPDVEDCKQGVCGIKQAFISFVTHLQNDGIRAIEKAIKKNAAERTVSCKRLP